jgi:OmpA-OmpF porin, OOP family
MNYQENEDERMSFVKWLFPAVMLAAITYYIVGACQNTSKETADLTEAVKVGIDSTMTSAKKMIDLSLPDGSKINVPEGSLEDQIIKFITDTSAVVDKNKWFNFDRLLFDTGKSSLKVDSQEQLEKVVAIMKAFPKVKLKIGGHTDNIGSEEENLKLSSERANVVMNAIILVGIDSSRLEAEGYGQKHPLTSNDTEEGRSQNRRIAVSIRDK